ncbi:hypothetical protein EJB05_49254, partial [Eragrostis curvula]
MLPSPDLIWDDEEDRTNEEDGDKCAACCLRNPRVAHRRARSIARSISRLIGVDTNNRYDGRIAKFNESTRASTGPLGGRVAGWRSVGLQCRVAAAAGNWKAGAVLQLGRRPARSCRRCRRSERRMSGRKCLRGSRLSATQPIHKHLSCPAAASSSSQLRPQLVLVLTEKETRGKPARGGGAGVYVPHGTGMVAKFQDILTSGHIAISSSIDNDQKF